MKYGINWTINIEVGDFFFGGGGLFSQNDPLDPLECVLGGHLLGNFPRGTEQENGFNAVISDDFSKMFQSVSI